MTQDEFFAAVGIRVLMDTDAHLVLERPDGVIETYGVLAGVSLSDAERSRLDGIWRGDRFYVFVATSEGYGS